MIRKKIILFFCVVGLLFFGYWIKCQLGIDLIESVSFKKYFPEQFFQQKIHHYVFAAEGRHNIFKFDFNESDSLRRWDNAGGRLVKGYEDTGSLFIESTDPLKHVNRQIQIPVESIDDRLITISAVVKSQNVSVPPNSWNGIKVMLVLETDHGKQYPQLKLGIGTFDWTLVKQVVRVPKGILKATLVVGLELVKGKVWFDDIEIRMGRPKREGKRAAIKFTGHTLPRLRGVMMGPRFNENDFRELATEWHANQIRWQMNWTPMTEAEQWAKDLKAYDRWLAGALKEADKALAASEKYGLMMLLDLHTPPGGRIAGGVCRMFSDKKYQDKLIEVWTKIARRYKGRNIIYAYDLLNEPLEPRSGATISWHDLATQVIDTIRAIDPEKPIVYEPHLGATPDGFDRTLLLDRDRVIYSFHMYKPNAFTLQGLGRPMGIEYPGVADGVMWNKERIREAMSAPIDFQKQFNVQMYVGEFSAIRWAPNKSAYRYMRDSIELFEEYGWDWSYHAFREFHGWSVEHGSDRRDTSPSKIQTDREKLLRAWFNESEKP